MSRIMKIMYFFLPPIIFLALTFFKLNTLSIYGDEWYSIECAQNLGRSFIALPYFLLLKIIITFFGISGLLRLISIFFGLLTVVTLYFLGKIIMDSRLGFIFSILGATSAFLITQCQEIRYYCILALFSSLSLLSFFYYLRYYKKKFLYLWLAVNIAIFLSHPNVLLLFLGEILYILYFYNRKYFWKFAFITSIGLIAIILLCSLKINALSLIFKFTYTGINFTDLRPRGFGFSALIKPFFAIFNFIFGPSVSPYNFFLIVPTTILYFILFVLGIRSKLNDGKYLFHYAIFLFPIPLLLLYFYAEPLSPPEATLLGPKHAMFVFPVWITIIGLGLYSLKRPLYKSIFFGLILVINFFILKELYYSNFSYYSEKRFVDFKKSSRILKNEELDGALFIIDGRSYDSFAFYNRNILNNKPLMRLWDLDARDAEALKDYRKIIFVCNDFHAYGITGNIDEMYSGALSKINKYYFLKKGYVDYPFFFYIFVNKNYTQLPNAILSASEFHSFEYADLTLPIKVLGREILSSFLVKKGKQLSLETFPKLPDNEKFLIFISCLEDSDLIKDGAKVGEISIFYQDGTMNNVDLIKGTNVFDAFATYYKDKIDKNSIAYSWIKYPLMTSKRFYPSIWFQHKAFLYKFAIPLENKIIERTVIKYFPSEGGLRIWSIYSDSHE
ncbi:MAG: hypothetical protein PHQ96_08375 [Candidatus Omnitrophica bacterium]|nr:hypothetical protein [Candidatus Omnitrophota bacterium]